MSFRLQPVRVRSEGPTATDEAATEVQSLHT
jgi:hypothetical protein